MKILTLFVFSFAFFCCNSSTYLIVNDDFLTDLSSENTRIAADLYLLKYPRNIDNLTYNNYIDYIGKNETPSARGISKNIQRADEFFFKAKSNSFLIILYYKDENKIIADISRTTFIDTLIFLKQNDRKPDLSEVAKKMKF